MKLAEVALNLPIKQTFSYTFTGFEKDIKIGKRVFVPFGRERKIIGYIVGIAERGNKKITYKNILRVLDEETILTPEILSLTKWMAEYYQSSWGQAITLATSPALHSKVTPFSPPPQLIMEKILLLPPTEQQDKAIAEIRSLIESGKKETILLEGVTASGKTEVYLRAIGYILEKNRQAIYLVPEISLIPQTSLWIKKRFGKRVAILHSQLSNRERYNRWQEIRKGKIDIVIGPRSAVFAPLSRLGLIIIDEEFETSYKEDREPKYHAREVAGKRAEFTQSLLILGTATPSLESYYYARTGKYKLIKLTERVEKRALPEIHLVNMRDRYRGGKPAIFSKELRSLMEERLLKGEQIILFLNRKGYHTTLLCRKCGFILKCKHCSLPLTYYRSRKGLYCHYCNFHQKVPSNCPVCGSKISFLGLGTERVERELKKLFPDIGIKRLDADTIKKEKSLRNLLTNFAQGKIKIVLGTQLLAKGHHFPNVTLIGVLNADTSLNLADFRAAERTFQLLFQVAGRSGRGEIPGEVIIQTYLPEHYAIKSLKERNFSLFYEKELALRKELGYPPYTHFVNIRVKGRKEDKVKKNIQTLSERLNSEKQKGMEILGPAPCSHGKIKNYFRYHLILKLREIEGLNSFLTKSLKEIKFPYSIDVDPMNML